MRKIITAILVVMAMLTPAAVSVPATATGPTVVSAGYLDVQRAKAVTRAAFKSLTRKQRRKLCRVYRYAPKTVVRSLATVPVKYGVSKRDARKGVRKGMRVSCRWY